MFGVQESVYHNVPVMVIPIFGDQFDNARRVEEKFLGKAIWNKFQINSQEIYQQILSVLQDPR